MIERRYSLLLLLLFTSLTAACGLNAGRWFGPAQNSTSAPETNIVTATLQTDFVIGPTAIQANLAQLESYRAKLILDFEGTWGEQPANGHIESLTEVNRASSAKHHRLQVETIIPNLPAGASEFFQIDDQVHILRAGETIWFKTEANRQFLPGELGLFEPDKLIILPPSVSTPPQPEQLNGLDVRRYRFNEANLSDPHLIFKQAQGEIWVATAGNYIMQYVISASLKTITPLPGAHILDEGTLSLRYSLSDINTDFTIVPPNHVTGTNTSSLAAIPRPADAQIVSFFPTLIEYTSAISSISATLFYRDELAGLAWTEESSTIFNEKSNLVFSKEGQTLTILIIPGPERDKIKILLDLKASP